MVKTEKKIIFHQMFTLVKKTRKIHEKLYINVLFALLNHEYFREVNVDEISVPWN